MICDPNYCSWNQKSEKLNTVLTVKTFNYQQVYGLTPNKVVSINNRAKTLSKTTWKSVQNVEKASVKHDLPGKLSFLKKPVSNNYFFSQAHGKVPIIFLALYDPKERYPLTEKEYL